MGNFVADVFEVSVCAEFVFEVCVFFKITQKNAKTSAERFKMGKIELSLHLASATNLRFIFLLKRIFKDKALQNLYNLAMKDKNA